MLFYKYIIIACVVVELEKYFSSRGDRGRTAQLFPEF